MSLILPPQVQIDQERARYAEEQEAWARKFSKEILQPLDPLLSIVWIKEEAPEYGGVVPGRWHVRRRNDFGPDHYLPITGPHGEYMEPHSGLLDQLRQNDLWRGDLSHRLWERRSEEAKRRAREREAERAERTEELRLRVKATTSPGVAFTDRPWSYRAGARRDKSR